MKKFFTLKKSFIVFLAILTFFSLLVFSALDNLTRSIDHLKHTEAKRIQATRLAIEYKNQTQALTRDTMAFVASEQPEFEESYKHHTAVMHGRALDTNGLTIPLIEKLNRAGFAPAELATLKSAYAKSTELAKTETQAINTAKGLFDDDKGGLKVGLPDPLLAKVMIFGQQYADAAASIARDIDDFNIMQSNRFTTDVEKASDASQRAYRIAISALVAQLLCGAVALFALFKSIKEPLDHGVRLAQQLAAGDLTAKVVVARQDELGSLLLALNGIGAGLQAVVSDVRERAVHIAAASHGISSGNVDLSRRTSEQASSLQETAAAMDELAATVKQNAGNAHQANILVSQTSSCAARGSQEVQKVVDTMQSIRQSSRKMADAVGAINSIAFQTNILALNAAVEAAHAGQQGRGFAVVAAEVRNLAQRSASSAKEIETLIRESFTQMDLGSQLVNSANSAMEEIVLSVKKVNQIMNEIAIASEEQACGIEQVTHAINQMDVITQKNAALVQEAASATLAQQEQAESLEATVGQFKLEGGNQVPANITSHNIQRDTRTKGELPALTSRLSHVPA